MKSLNEAYIDRLSFDFAGICPKKSLPDIDDHEDSENMDDDWITVNGTHVLIDEEGIAQSGGKLKGKAFSNATSRKAQSQSNYACKLVKPKRPKKSDYTDEDEYLEDRSKYRKELETYQDERDKLVKRVSESPRRYTNIEQVKEWGKNNGVDFSELDSSIVDPRLFDDMIDVFEEMFERYPQVKARQDSYRQWGVYNGDPHRVYYFAAQAGLIVGTCWKNYEDSVRSIYDGFADGFFERGDGTIKTSLRHEFGHMVDFCIRDQFSTYDLRQYKDREEIVRRQNLEAQYIEELKQLTTKHCKTEYAFENEYEAFAEGFSAYTGDPDSEFGRAFGEFMARWL